MARGGKRPGAGRKPNKVKAKEAASAPILHPAPTPYDPVICEQARKLCELGATDVELADFFGVSTPTVYRWKIEFSEFCNATKVGKEAADDRVERSLYNRSVGYTFDAVKIFMPGGAKKPVHVPYREHVPPDTAAAKHWLCNRRPQSWRDKHEVGVSGAVGTYDVEKLKSLSLEEMKLVERVLTRIAGVGSPPGDTPGGDSEAGS